MNDIKVIITADFHLGLNRYSVFEDNKRMTLTNDIINSIKQIKSFCIKKEVDVLIIVGDLLNNNHPSPFYNTILINLMNNLDKIGMKIIIIPGNHENNDLKKNSLSPISRIKFKNIRVIEKPEAIKVKNYNIVCMPFISKKLIEKNSDYKKIIIKYIKKLYDKKYKNWFIGHFHYQGAKTGSEEIILRGGVQFIDKRWIEQFDKVWLGHIHKYQKIGKNIYYPGSITRIDFGEIKEDKGFLYYDKDDVEFIKLKVRNFYEIDFDLKKEIKIKNVNKYKDAIVKLKYHIDDRKKIKYYDLKGIEKQLEGIAKFVKPEKVINKKEKEENKKIKNKGSQLKIIRSYIKSLDLKERLNDKVLELCEKEYNKLLKDIVRIDGPVKLKRFKLINYLSHEKTEIFFDKLGKTISIYSINGDEEKSVGSGKTSIVEIIDFLFYNKTRFSKTIYAINDNNDAKKMIGEGDFSIGENILYIIRSIDIKKNHTLEVRVVSKSGKEIFKTKDIEKGNDYLKKIFIFDDKCYERVFHLSKRSPMVLNEKGATRQDTLLKFTNVDIFLKMLLNFKNKKKNYKEIYSDLKSKIDLIKDKIEEFNEEDSKKKLKKLEKEIELLDQKIQIVEKKKIKIKKYLDLKDSFDKKNEELKGLNENNKLTKKNISENESKINQYKKVNKKYIEEIKKIDEDIFVIVESLKGEVNNINGKIKDVNKDYKDYIKEKNKKCNHCNQIIKNEKEYIKMLSDKKRKLLDKQKTVNKNYEENDRIKKHLDKLNNGYKINKIKIEDCEKEMVWKNAILKENNIKVKELNIELNKFEKFDNDKLTKEYYSKIKNRIESYRKDLSNNKEDKTEINTNIKFVNDNKKDLKKYKKDRRKYEIRLKVYDKLIEIFDRTGIQSFVLGDVLEYAENYANDILEMVNIDRRLIIELNKTTVIDLETNKKRESSGSSGGEEDILELAFRLGLADYNKNYYENNIDFIILDEFDKSLDDYYREKFIEIINNFLSKYFSKVLVISHSNQLEGKLQSGINVIKEKGISSVNFE